MVDYLRGSCWRVTPVQRGAETAGERLPFFIPAHELFSDMLQMGERLSHDHS